MKGAIFVFNEVGVSMAKTINEHLDFDIYRSSSVDDNTYRKIPIGLTEFVGELMSLGYTAFIYISACGIAVRTMAPHISDKVTDPAVVVVDCYGKNVISLLSGHLGGANELTKLIAAAINGQAIITTASDQMGILAVDMLAKKLDCQIDCMEKAKMITAMLINRKKIALLSDIPLVKELSNRGLTVIKTIEEVINFQGLIIIAESRGIPREIPREIPTVKLTPKYYSLGIGCRRGVQYTEIAACLKKFLHEHKIDVSRIIKIATIPLKAKEQGIISLTHAMDIPLEIVDLEKIVEVEHRFSGSDFVKDTVGVKSVAQPCAYISSGRGKVVGDRFAENGVTLALAIISKKGDDGND